MSKIEIFGTMRSRATRCVWAAEELGLAYELVNVDTGKGEQKQTGYLAINPNAHIPAMRDGDLTMFESLAINLYLAKKADGPLAPATLAEDALMTMWSIWASKIKMARALTNPTITERGMNRISLATPANASATWMRPPRMTVAMR